jgi:uncharacterized membrane protein
MDADGLQAPTRPASNRWFKPTLWTVMALMTLSVIRYSEYPIFRQAKEQAYLKTIPFLIIPHALCGVAAFVIGPFQFSIRMRRRYPKTHRVLGRVYVGSVLVAASFAMVLANHRRQAGGEHFGVAVRIQASAWLITTIAAFVTARNRQIQQHREWMVRSYAVTFTFIGTRVFSPLQDWHRLGEAFFAMEIITVTLIAVLIPDVALSWRQLTTRRR